jgi:hypothetical protein
MSKLSFLGKKKFVPLYISLGLTILLYVGIYVMARFPSQLTFGLDIPEEFVSHFVYLLPGPLWTDIILLFLFPIIMFFLIQYISPYLTHGLVKIHGFFYIFRKKPEYGILKQKGDISAGKIFLRGLKLSFLAFVIASAFIQWGLGGIFRFNYSVTPLFNSEALFLATYILVPIVMFIFFPIWILEDSGLIAFRIFRNNRKNPDIEGVNRIFRDFMEYFIGFSTIFVYITIIIKTINNVLSDYDTAALLIPIILIFLPFLVTGLITIPLIFYEYYLEQNNDRIHGYLEKKNFEYISIPDYKDLKRNKSDLEKNL